MLFPQPISAEVKLILYASITVGLLGAGAYGAYRWLEADRIRLEADRDAWEKSSKVYESVAEDFKQEKDEADRVAKARAIQLVALQKELADAKKAREMAAKADPSVDAYLNTVRPDVLRRLRRTAAGCSPNFDLQCTERPITADSYTADGRRKEQKP